MVKTILAYVITFSLAPLFGGFGGIVAFPFMPIAKKIPILAGVGHIFIGFLTVWFGKIIFSWFGLKITWLMVIILIVGFSLNSLNRLRAASAGGPTQFQMELSFSIGELIGVITGGFYFVT